MNYFLDGVHTTAKPYECNTCGKKFKTEPSYRFHLKMHQTSLDHRCDICGAGFKTKHYMLGHMKVHSEVKNYVCAICSMSFKRSGQLSKHMRKHTGNMFYCTLCVGMGFLDSFSLKEHIERVHIGVRYRCDTCGKDYGSRKHLRQHQNAQFHDRTSWTKLVPPTTAANAEAVEQLRHPSFNVNQIITPSSVANESQENTSRSSDNHAYNAISHSEQNSSRQENPILAAIQLRAPPVSTVTT